MKNTRQNASNFISLFFYFSLLAFVGYLLHLRGFNIRDVNIKELIILTFASYRLTRIMVFEKIFKFFRDFVKSRPNYYVFNTIKFIITCPWCMGVWATLLAVVFFFLIPFGDLLVYILAIAGVASLVVTASNLMVLKNKEMQNGRENDD